MSELVADLFVSLDGFAGGDDVGPFFGYAGPELDGWIGEHLSEPQRVVLGRRTYEALARISAAAPDPGSRRLTALPKLVASRTLDEPLEWENATLLRGDALEALAALKRDSEAQLRTMGSMSLVRSLLGAGLVDRLRLAVFPLLLGERGREPAFEGVAHEGLVLADTQVLDRRVVVLEYRPVTEA